MREVNEGMILFGLKIIVHLLLESLDEVIRDHLVCTMVAERKSCCLQDDSVLY